MNSNLYSDLVCYKKTGAFPAVFSSTKPNFRSMAEKYTVNSKNNLLRNGKLVVKDSEKQEVFLLCHGSKTHSGRDKTWQKMNARFYFHGGEKYVREEIANCVVCTNKRLPFLTAGRSPLKPLPIDPLPMMRIHLDLAGPFPASALGNTYIAVAIDGFLKYPEGMGNSSSKSV